MGGKKQIKEVYRQGERQIGKKRGREVRKTQKE